MIDFSKKIKKAVVEKSDNPVDIYNGLDRTSVAGPLRASQEMVLSKWYSERIDDKDVIIKLHTGEGKTLIGLLTLMTNLNRGNSPCIYVCPNKYLVEQVCKEASKFGIPVCIFRKNCASVPEERSAIPLQTEQSSAGLLVAIIYSTIPARKFKTICLGCHSA